MAVRISVEKEEEILLLHRRGMSRRKIKKETGVSRGTVDAYINDTHKVARDQKPAPQTVGEIQKPVVPKYPCPGCGALVYYSPCRICTTARRAVIPSHEPLTLALRKKHRERYKAVRADGGGELIGYPVE